VNSRTVALCLFLLIIGCNRPNGDSEGSPSGNIHVPVSVSRVIKGNIEATVTASGATEALRKEKVVSPVAGRVISLNVLEGSSVHIGDVLMTLRTREAQATIEGAQSLLRSARTDRQKQDAERALALADSLQPQITLRARFDGVVASRNVTEGELVADQAELLTIIDVSTIVFLADVPINSISNVRPGLGARVRFPQLLAGELSAVVDAVSPQAESQSQSVKARLRFRGLTEQQQRLLKANVPGTARIIIDVHRDALLVGRSVLLHDDETDTYSVVIVTEDSLAHIVPVTVGARTDSTVEVRSEQLRAGQNVIIRGQYALTDSIRVTLEPQ